VPALYVLAALALGRLIPNMDRRLGTFTDIISQATVLSTLSSIVSGMIAFTGIVFSMAFVMLQFSNSAYSPRLVHYFLEDRVIRHALGMFIATFLYTLVALLEIDRAGADRVLGLTLLVALLLVLGSIVMFLALLQRLSVLQVSNVLRMVGRRGRNVIAEMYPPLERAESAGPPPPHRSLAEIELPPATQVITHAGGPATVLELNIPLLRLLARRAGALIEIEYPIGDTVPDGAPLLRVRGGQRRLAESWLRRAIRIGEDRSIEQDPKYAIRLIADIAIRALSPAVNDPTTAVQALDQLEDLLRRIGASRLDVGYAYDQNGLLRVIYPTPGWEDFLALAIDEIRYYGAHSIQVMRRLCALLEDLEQAVPPERQAAVKYHLARVTHSINRTFQDAEDRIEAQQPDRQGIGVSIRIPDE
jgi:uncharacterized membrane protein